MNIKPLTHRSLAVLLTTILLLVAIPATAVLAATTTETVPTGNGFYSSWTGDYTLVDEGTASASCASGDYILSATINQRESVSIPLTSIPNGSTITDVSVIARDRGDTTTGGTYRTFVRLNGTNSADSASHSVTGTSGACTGSVNDSFDVTDTVKSGTTTLEVGVVKGNATGVRVGVLSATITYTLTTTTTTLTSNNNPSTYGSSVIFTATVSPSAATGTVEFYDGAALLGTGTLSSGTATLKTGALTAAASPHSITAKYLGDIAYAVSTSSAVSQVVNKANATCNISGYSGVYDGSAHGASGSCTGGGTLDLGATFTNVPGGTAHWTFTGDSNYNNQSGDVAVSISKANAACSSIAGYSVTYDGNSHAATGSCQGVGSDGTLVGLDLSAASHTDAGSYLADPWTFTDVTGNYSNTSGTVDSNIAQAEAVISIAPYSLTYDSSEHSSNGTATGVNAEDLSAGLDLSGTAHTAAGSYMGDAWTFTDSAGNYKDASGTVDNNIDKANADCSTVAGYSVKYDGDSHTAAGSCQGVGSDGALTGLDLSATTHTAAGSYTGDAWTFTDVTGNYNASSGTVDSDIAKADAVIKVTSYSATYDGFTYTSTGTATGVKDEDLSDGLDLIATSHTNAGTYNVDAWTFTAPNANYNDASGTVDNEITKADVVIVVTPYHVTYDGSAHLSSATALGVEDEDLSAGLDLSATSHSAAGIYSGDAWTFTAPNANYNDASGTVDNEITKADVVIVVAPYTFTYDGSEHSSTGTALGVNDEDLSAGLDLSATAHTAAGSYAGDTWTFTSPDANYKDANGTVDNSIAKADPDCSTIAGYAVTYDGNSHTATGSCLGVVSEGALTGLDLSATAHTDIGTYEGDAWTFTDVTGNYNDAHGTVNSVISAKLVPTLSISGGTFTYDGTPHAATVTGSVGGTVGNVKYDGSSTVPTHAGSYAVTADFLPDDAVTYESLTGASAGTLTIDKATPDCSSISGYSASFDGNPHTATGFCQGVGSDGTLVGLDSSATTHTALGTYNDSWTFTDVTGNYENASGTVNSSINDATPPAVNSVVRASLNPTSASNVDFTVTFSEVVTGVTADDFSLFTSGIAGASVSSVSGSGSVYTVSVNTGAGNGKLRLDVMNNNSIKDAANNPLAAAFNSGDMYQVLKGVATVGVFRPSNGALYLKNTNATGFADIQINYGQAGDYPVTGDWDGNGTDTIGIYRKGVFYLRNSNSIGYADLTFAFGAPGDQPVAGDWNGDGIDTIGVYRSSTGTFYLRNSNTSGAPEMIFSLGVAGDVGIAGDWDGDGKDTTGVFRPSNGAIYLKNANATGFADVQINYGIAGDKPVTGDWDNDGIDTIGVYRNGTFYLRNSNTVGIADLSFALGVSGDMPIAGNWDGKP